MSELFDFPQGLHEWIRTIAAVLGLIFAASIGSYIANTLQRRKGWDINRVVIEQCALTETRPGVIEMTVTSWGGQKGISEIFRNPALAKKIRGKIKKTSGTIALDTLFDHRDMMTTVEDEITGNDMGANMSNLMSRDHQNNCDTVAFAMVFNKDERRGDDVNFIRILVINPEWLPRLSPGGVLPSGDVLQKITAKQPRHIGLITMLYALGVEWQNCNKAPGAHSPIWTTEVRTQKIFTPLTHESA